MGISPAGPGMRMSSILATATGNLCSLSFLQLMNTLRTGAMLQPDMRTITIKIPTSRCVNDLAILEAFIPGIRLFVP
jgi:hypothetical protein